MAQPVPPTAVWRIRSGLRLTSPAQVLSIDVEAYANLKPVVDGGEGGVASVEWEVRVNDIRLQTPIVTAPTLRFPNYTSQPSPIPGSYGGGMAPTWLYGFTLDPSTLPGGTCTIRCVVTSAAGTKLVMPNLLTVYLDHDAVDRRPSNKVLYVSVTGNDANPGTEGSPLRWPQTAMNMVVSNPAGSTSAARDARGGEVVFLAGDFVDARSGGAVGDWHCSGDGWVKWTFRPGARLLRGDPPGWLHMTGFNGTGKCAIQFVDATLVGNGWAFHVPTANVTPRVWIDGGESYSTLNGVGPTNWSCGFLNDNAMPLTFSGGGPAETYASCHHRHHCADGFLVWTDMHDVLIEYYLGIAMQTGQIAANPFGNHCCNVVCRYQRRGRNANNIDVQGWAEIGYGTGGGSNLRIDVPSANVGRLYQQVYNAGFDYGVKWDQCRTFMTGWGVLTKNMPVATMNGVWPVLGRGTDGSGRPYVDLSIPGAVPQVGVDGSLPEQASQAETGNLATQMRYDPHPDILQYNADTTDSIHSNVAVIDVTESQGWFGGGHLLTRCWLANVSGCELIWEFGSVTLDDCGWVHVSGSGLLHGTSGTITRGCIVESVFGSAVNVDLAHGVYLDGNHVVSGALLGSNCTTGAWFNGDPLLTMQPLPGQIGTALGILELAPHYAWSPATDSRGVTKQAGIGDWSLGAGIIAGPLPTVATTPPTGILQASAQILASALPSITIVPPTGSLVGGASITGQGFAAVTIVPMTGTLVPGVGQPGGGDPEPGGVRGGTVRPFWWRSSHRTHSTASRR